MSKKISFGFALPEDLLREVDARRGLVPRTRYIEQLVVRHLRPDEESLEIQNCEDERPELRRGTDRRRDKV